MNEASLVERAMKIPDLNNSDATQLSRGRLTNCDFLVGVGATSLHASVRDGKVEPLARGPLLMRSWRFAIRGEAEAWEKFWRPVPPPEFHDIFALAKHGAFVIEGDWLPLMSGLLFYKGLLALPRRLEG